ncbi:uncharacterized protein LOC133184869 [Saccostrea echinata]|uniref:uncharacterized protein LOC133184869 n=1 Tax=Saccostrea echinata TaxID=191078 RepID=UPI002A823435|nr:uncharacterized protein LOC133184869 [Saccostrea echinata]
MAEYYFINKEGHFHRKVPPSEHDEWDDITLSLLKDTSNDTYFRAKSCLASKRFVVLRGVQGSGKTYLAKNLADNINQLTITQCQVHWVHDVLENEIPKITSNILLVFDDIFYELQSKDEFQESIKMLEELFKKVYSSESLYVIVTIPTYAWKTHSDQYQNKTCLSYYVDLDTLSNEEKTEIFNHHLRRSVIKEEGSTRETKLIMRDSVKSAIIKFERCDFIGYPSCVAWICKMQDQFDLHNAARFMDVPVTRIKSDIYRLRDSKKFKERKMFLLLAYMAFSGGTLNEKKCNEDLLTSTARIFFQEDDCKHFLLQEHDESIFLLQEKYIRQASVGLYEFYLGVVRKIVLIVALEKNVKALKGNVSQDIWKRVAFKRGKKPSELAVGELSHMYIK